MIAPPTHYVCGSCDKHMRQYRVHYFWPAKVAAYHEIVFTGDRRYENRDYFLCASCAPTLKDIES